MRRPTEFADGRPRPGAAHHGRRTPLGRTRNLPETADSGGQPQSASAPRAQTHASPREWVDPAPARGDSLAFEAIPCCLGPCSLKPRMLVAVSPTHDEFSAVVPTVPTRPMQYVQAANIRSPRFHVERRSSSLRNLYERLSASVRLASRPLSGERPAAPPKRTTGRTTSPRRSPRLTRDSCWRSTVARASTLQRRMGITT